MNVVGTGPEYDVRLRAILSARDWEALREFSREHNAIPDDVYLQGPGFWEVLLHKLTCARADLAPLHADSHAWLAERGYTPDLGGY